MKKYDIIKKMLLDSSKYFYERSENMMKLYCETDGCRGLVANLPEGEYVKIMVSCPKCGERIYIYGTPGKSLVLDHEKMLSEQKGVESRK